MACKLHTVLGHSKKIHYFPFPAAYRFSSFIRPLQINSLFPVHYPHLVTVSSKYSITLYSSIIFRLFLHTDRLSKAILKQGQLTCQQCYQVGTNFTFVLFLQLKREETSLSMLYAVFLWLCHAGK